MYNVISINPQEAWQMLQDNPKAMLIDVRSGMEFLFVGHPKGATNIAWIDDPDWDINPNFATEIEKELSKKDINAKDTPILLICRSGVRSLEAGKVLITAGFSSVYNILDGFEGNLDEQHHRNSLGGWRFHNLPWEQC